SYTGTLIDDLVSKEIGEPYRMMTSRSEYRLLLRQDNADTRLTPMGREIGLVDDHRWNLYETKQIGIAGERKRLQSVRIHPSAEWQATLREFDEELKQPATLEELLRRPRVPYSAIEKMSPASELSKFEWSLELETEVKYAGYIERQKAQVKQAERLDNVKLPLDIDYMKMENLAKEAREKLTRIKPITLGQASRIGGITPADVSVLLVFLEARRRSGHVQELLTV
ncbi:MAG: tRNA uridine-5-carboxymethylaminomethyl(34) synthesis enzyme MnmG, partial [Candidatus Obscuribacterales bacterium]|nr:tRNA uridine-5-carboxymethylaminomethyl(34) synthesis enzyme MnmG [Candidatus Obscuribacterales bacterium]